MTITFHTFLQFDQGGTVFSDRKFYLGNDSTRYHDAYTLYFNDVVELLGGNRSNAEEMSEKMWRFETSIAEVRPAYWNITCV